MDMPEKDKSPAEIIGTRRGSLLQGKDEIWKLVHDSYTGGDKYIKGGHLFQYMIEDKLRYEQRLKRADYTNHTQQINDMLRGFIYAQNIERNINKKFEYIKTGISKGKSLDLFMKMVATNCLLSTCGMLIDSPRFENNFLSVAERKIKNLNPYAVFYNYTNICDFELDDDGELKWIILDNSYIDKSYPHKKPEKKVIKRLWTREYYQDAEKIKTEDTKEEKWILGDEKSHNIEIVPFILVNSRDTDGNGICDSPFEDVSLKSRKIFNIESWCDETLAGSSFQVLFMPYENENDVKQIEKMFKPEDGGISDIPLIPYKGSLSGKPFFDGPKIDNIDKYVTLINHYTGEILAKFGMKTDSKGSWESGVAKSIDFDKTESYLRGVAEQLESTEKRIIEICARWEGKLDIEADIKYPDHFEQDDIDKELNRLATAFTIPSKKLQKKAHKAMITKIFPDIEQSELDEIEAELDGTDIDSGDDDKSPEKKTPKNGNQSTDLKEDEE